MSGAASEGPGARRGVGPVLVSIVGDEPLAPLVLARQVSARRVICVGQPVAEWRVEPLLRLLRREGRAAEWLALSPTDVPSGIDELAAGLSLRSDDEVVFDLTNARGVLGFALYELAVKRERGLIERGLIERCRVLRIDWSDGLVRSISPDRATTEPLKARLSLAEYLEAHGKHLLGFERGPGSRSPFGDAARQIASSIPLARALIDATHQGQPDRPLRLKARHTSNRLIDALIADGVVQRQGRALFATSDRAFQFLHGRWLEEYLFEVADASSKFDDCASGVRFGWSVDGDLDASTDLANEIDFAGTAGGRATVASCKTGRHDVNGPLYELLTVAERAAGRSVITVFATVETLDRVARQRAAALGVRVLDAPRLADPAVVLRALLTGAPTPALGADPASRDGREPSFEPPHSARHARQHRRRHSSQQEADRVRS